MTRAKRTCELQYAEMCRLEPLVRKWNGQLTEDRQALEAGKVLGRRITTAQIGHFRNELGLTGGHRHQWAMKANDRKRLDLMLQKHEQLAVFRGPKRVYIIPFKTAMTRRDKFVAGKPWEKSHNGTKAEAGMVSTS